MRDIIETGLFRKDVKRIAKRGKNLRKLLDIVSLLAMNNPLPASARAHRLSGTWANHHELHIEPDWLLIYIVTEETVTLIRTGSHADLFR